VFGKALHTLATQALGTLAALAVGVILARVLGPGGRGVVSYAWLVLGLAAVYADGPAAAVVAQYAGDKFRRADVYRAMLRGLPVLIVPAVAGFVIAAFALPGQLPLLAVACALPCAVYAQCVKGFYLAESRISSANLIDLAAGAGYAVLGSAVVLLGGGVVGALAAWVAAYAASALYGLLRLDAAPQLERATRHAQPAALARAQLVFGGKSGLVYAAGYVNLRMGAFVVAALLGSASLGIYTIVIAVSELLWKISNALAWSAFGRIAGDDDAGARVLVGRLTRTIVLLELGLGGLVFALGPWLIVRVYGAAFAGAALPLRIMVLGVAAYAMEPVLGYFLLVRAKRPLLVLLIQLASAALCAGLAALAIPAYGLAGVAAATAASYAAVVVVKAFFVAASLRMPVGELFVPRLADVRAVAAAARRFALRTARPSEVPA
jgi:O-antigen/teichoic acid export membrane protein